MKIKIIIQLIFLTLLGISKSGISQDYFKQEFQNNNLNRYLETDSLNTFLSSEIYSDIWIKSLDINEDNAEGFYKRAATKIEKGYFKDALEDLNKSIEIDSNYSFSYGLRALCNIQLNGNIKESLKDINKAIEIDENNWFVYNLRGYFYLNINKLVEAEQDFNKALELKGDIPESYFYLGLINLSYKKYSKAKSYFKKAIKFNINFYDAYIQYAICNYYTGKYSFALENIDDLLKFNPYYTNAYLIKGDILQFQGDYKKAFDCYNKVIEIEPYNFIGLVKRALIALYFKDYDCCFNDFKLAFSKGSIVENSSVNNIKVEILKSINISAYHFNVEGRISSEYISKYKEGVCYYLSGNYDFANNIFDELISNKVSVYEIYELKGVIDYKFSRYEKSSEYFEKALELGSESAFLYINMGVLQSFQNLNRKAALSLLKALRIEPNNPRIYYLLAKLNERLGNWISAINYYNKVLELDAKLIYIHEERAKLKDKLGDFKGAVSDYEIMIKYYPKTKELYHKCAELKLNLRDYESAIEYLEVIVQIDPREFDVYFMIGNIYFMQNKYQEAIKYYDKAWKMVSWDIYEFHIALSYQKMDNLEEAIKYYKESLSSFEKGYILGMDYQLIFKSYINLGFCYKQIKNKDKSEDSFRNAINVDSNNSKRYVEKAQYFEEISEFLYGITCLQKSISIDSTNYVAYIKLARLYKKNKEIENALSTLKKAMVIDSMHYVAYEDYGRIKREIGDYKDALKYSNIAIYKNPLAQGSKVNIAICELAIGNSQKAQSLFAELKSDIENINLDAVIKELNILINKNINKKVAVEIKEMLLSNV
ncbi:MAG: tetratricopeptide repeat protein [Bacteroidales bacterium]|jgi:tetratricopeptide (TPR) repeat protein|nr:tetratricopeptide repeat protein [Bacteroidales bacterium]